MKTPLLNSQGERGVCVMCVFSASFQRFGGVSYAE